ncbi:MAG: sigma-54-dependent Fis family transcriptional regulator [Candidatus Accumulibacter sp.]|nr:sigma-54-dependent Fis family transcriptional regulator [Accumulibacter sp.]MBA4092995.1 sigma-54-dependent Fis family transcriptional regulator [Accumulibacter sp.]
MREVQMRDVLVLDPQGTMAERLAEIATPELTFTHARSIAEARQLLQQKRYGVGLAIFDALAVDLALAQQQEIERLVLGSSAAEWIAVVGRELLADTDFQAFVVRAFHDFHTLPIDPERLLPCIGHAHGKARLRLALNGKNEASGRFGIYGASPAMCEFFRQMEKVVKADLPVLVGGETGTGKELVAQAIHRHSQRSTGAFIVVNCGAIPTELIQSELFGHEKGAFTGAFQRKIGSIEAANGGLLFLDEIGDLPLALQANLLRVLQEHTITRVGSTQAIPVDFRIVAATHVDLREAVKCGRFREDLYYRLNVLHMQLPPLRDRVGDVPILADAVFRKLNAAGRGSRASGFSSEALKAMNAYDWPGNVRELINRVHRALIMSENRLISAADLGLEDSVRVRENLTLEDARASFDRDIVESSLRANRNNVSRAARQLGVSRVTLYRMMNKLNIAPLH